jgi:hypothetical protein
LRQNRLAELQLKRRVFYEHRANAVGRRELPQHAILVFKRGERVITTLVGARRLLPLLVAIVLAGAEITPAGQPTTQPQAPTTRVVLDLSGPKEALATLLGALASGDAEMARQAVIADDALNEGLDAWAAAADNSSRLVKAALERFGPGGEVASPFDFSRDVAQELAEAKQQVAGDMAVVIAPDQPPFHVRRIDGQWKVELAASPYGKQLIQYAPVMSGFAEAAKQTTEEVRAGRYATAVEAQQALANRLRQVMSARPPRVEPTTRPAPTTQR